MKNLAVLLLMILSLSQCAQAKQPTVIATYQKTMAIPTSVTSIADPNIRQMAIAQLKNKSMTLTMVFNGKMYGFSSGAKVVNGTFSVSGENSLMIDLTSKKAIAQRVVIDKNFLVDQPYALSKWDIKKDTAIVNGKKCIKAVYEADPSTVAWYCPEIPCQMGPNGYGGLPGLIMKMETPTATFQVTDYSISTSLVKIVSAQSGTKVTPAEFKRIREERLKSLGASGNGGVQVIKM